MTTSKRNLVVCSLACLAVFLFGGLFQPGEWYAGLRRAPWTPPDIAFPIVWALLYCAIAIAGWQIFNSGQRALQGLWIAQLLVNGLWSWLFFGQHWPLASLVDIVLLGGLVLVLMIACFKAGLRQAGWLLLPYLLWLELATTLNAYIVRFN
ncbi:MAG: tryptophan-rich sensory protein [Gammaproteobacteria bacterium]|nr:tryptophan-rich sensory protein [Gammaproteobacteria bacterium]